MSRQDKWLFWLACFNIGYGGMFERPYVFAFGLTMLLILAVERSRR